MCLLVNHHVLKRTHLNLYILLLYVYTAAGPRPYFIMYEASIRLLIAIDSVRRLGKSCDVFTSCHTWE
jgi:hypothetical protein